MIRLAVRVSREQAEVVLAELLELAPAGVEELTLEGERVEYAVYGAPGELPALPDLQALAAGGTVEISTSEIADDWSERWKDFHRPVLIPAPTANSKGSSTAPTVPAIRVRPPWEPAEQTAARHVVELVIDPGQAFGTGAHATTRLCLELLLELASSSPWRGQALDLGTGSGVLAIAAAKLGFQPVIAVDHDPLSVEAARENATVNGVSVDVRLLDLRDGEIPTAPMVLANLLRGPLLHYARALTTPPGRLIVSGLLAEEADHVAGAFAAHGLRERERRQGGEWVALCLATDEQIEAVSGG